MLFLNFCTANQTVNRIKLFELTATISSRMAEQRTAQLRTSLHRDCAVQPSAYIVISHSFSKRGLPLTQLGMRSRIAATQDYMLYCSNPGSSFVKLRDKSTEEARAQLWQRRGLRMQSDT